MNWQPIASAVGAAAATAILGAFGLEVRSRGQAPAVPADDCAAVVRRLAEAHGETKAESERWACKYRHASVEGVARGWEKPSTRAAWDAICGAEGAYE